MQFWVKTNQSDKCIYFLSKEMLEWKPSTCSAQKGSDMCFFPDADPQYALNKAHNIELIGL